MKSGLEVIAENSGATASWGRCGLLCNQASVTTHFEHAVPVLQAVLGGRLGALFGPQHGIFGTVQDNMIETMDSRDPGTNLPIYSLYSKVREPTAEMLADLDTLIIDLQITGTRVYTFKWTIAACLRAAKKHNKRIVILDRPNPVGGRVLEGPILDLAVKSFVGEYQMPMRHGLTAGEAACLFNQGIGAELELVKLEGWNPESYLTQWNRPWVMTSPNLPTPEPVVVYPGAVIFEGTNISEGRGTSLPFQLIGAPYIKNSEQFIQQIKKYDQPEGVFLRPVEFMPTFHKWAGEVCFGVQIHVTDPAKVRSFKLCLAMVKAAMDLGGEQFAWKKPPYEYEYEKLPMNLILGMNNTHDVFVERDFSVGNVMWSQGHRQYIEDANRILVYPRQFGQL